MLHLLNSTPWMAHPGLGLQAASRSQWTSGHTHLQSRSPTPCAQPRALTAKTVGGSMVQMRGTEA